MSRLLRAQSASPKVCVRVQGFVVEGVVLRAARFEVKGVNRLLGAVFSQAVGSRMSG